MSTDVSAIRKREIEVFDAFTERALEIVNLSDTKKGTLADACKLVETALKAGRRDGPDDTDGARSDDSTTKKFIEQITKVHPEQGANENA